MRPEARSCTSCEADAACLLETGGEAFGTIDLGAMQKKARHAKWMDWCRYIAAQTEENRRRTRMTGENEGEE